MRIALDAMGGDYAPQNIIEGAALGLKEFPEIDKLYLVGDTTAIERELNRLECKDSRVEIFHASEIVAMKESPAKSVRHKKDSSICRAVDLVKNGSADALVSAGHTGAAVAACVLKLRTLKGIERPAVACLLPTESKVLFYRCRGKPGFNSGESSAVRDHGLRFFPARARLQEPFRRIDVDRRGGHQGQRRDQAGL